MATTVSTLGGARIKGTRLIVKTASGNLYTLINHFVTGATQLQMFKSSDGGATWAEMNSAARYTSTVEVFSMSMDIDANGLIHLFALEPGSNSTIYKTFNTVNDLWGATEEPDPSMGAPTVVGCSIAIDANNKPHVIYTRKFSAMGSAFEVSTYINKVGTSWSTKVDFDSNDSAKKYYNPDILINASNFPVICYTVDGDKNVHTRIANTNTPTTLAEFAIVQDSPGATKLLQQNSNSLAMDADGIIYLAYITEGNGLGVKKGTQAGQTVATDVIYAQPSIVANGTDIYVFAENDSNGNIVYHKRATIGTPDTYGARTVLEAGTFQTVKARWSARNNPAYSPGIDYVFGDGTNTFYGSLSLGGAVAKVNGFKVWNGTAWVVKPVKVWNGTSFVAKPLKRWTGTAWVNVEY